MSITRGPLPADSFTIVPNAWLRDPALSWRAKGLLCYIASHAAGHKLTVEQILAEGEGGKDAVRAGLVELEGRGYLVRSKLRAADGKITGTDYTLADPGGSASGGVSRTGNDQGEQPVTAGGDQCGKPSAGSAAGKKTTPTREKKTREDEASDADASPTAQTIVASFIDWLRARPEPVELTPSVKARYGKAVKALLQANYDVDTIKRALALQTERGKAGWPSMLDSFCVEVQNRPVSGPPAQARTFRQMDADDRERESLIVEAMQMVLDEAEARGRAVSATEARQLVNQLIAEGKLDLNTLKARVATGYSGHDVITGEAREVTGS